MFRYGYPIIIAASLAANQSFAQDVETLSSYGPAFETLLTTFNAGYSEKSLLQGDTTASQSIAAQPTNENSGGNESWLLQSGQRNQASVEQIGSKNSIRLSQSGKRNTASLSQDGRRNIMELKQSGTRNSMVLTQDGNRNRATMTQDGTTNNVMQLQQTGNGNVANYEYTGGIAPNLNLTQRNGSKVKISQRGS